MPVMFIDEYIVCIKSRQHTMKAINGQFIQMVTTGGRGSYFSGLPLVGPSGV